MSDTIYSEKDLKAAREFFKREIPKHVPEWLEKPTGELRGYWSSDDAFSASYLINLWLLILSIRQNTDVNSSKILDKKIELLLHYEGENYTHLFTELDVIAHWCRLIGQVILEPSSKIDSNQVGSKTVDFKIQFHNEDIYFEVTTLHFQKFEDFLVSVRSLHETLIQFAQKRRLRRIVEFELPMCYRIKDLTLETIGKFKSLISENAYGSLKLNLPNYHGTMRWFPLPHLTDESGISQLPKHINYWTQGSIPDSYNGVAMAWRKTGCIVMSQFDQELNIANVCDTCLAGFSADDKDGLLKSLRNTLDSKRRQFRLNKPYVLVIAASDRLLVPEITDIIAERIWPNPDYDWISAIALYIHNLQFERQDLPIAIQSVGFNPSATHKLPISFQTWIHEHKEN